MSPVLKKVGVVVLVLAGLLAAGVAVLVIRLVTAEPEIITPPDYETTVSTAGEIEAEYLAHGSHDVASFTEDVDEDWEQYEVHYPTDLEDGTGTYPVIVMANGSGVWASRYPATFEHYASWGFIVIGNEHDTAFAGDSSDASLAYLAAADADPDSVLHDKVDLDHVGIIGHSQGGVGVFNAITSQPNGDTYDAAVSISPVGEDTARALNWTYQPAQVDIPIMVVAGTEDDVITPADLADMYSHITAPKVMGLRSGTNHPEMLYSADGYATAWMMWHLQDDAHAADAFTGDDAEMPANPHWQDVRTDLP